jgi:hypothetical protein
MKSIAMAIRRIVSIRMSLSLPGGLLNSTGAYETYWPRKGPTEAAASANETSSREVVTTASRERGDLYATNNAKPDGDGRRLVKDGPIIQEIKRKSGKLDGATLRR